MSVPADATLTVLVIEDEATIRRFVRTALEDAGYRVLEAGTADTGLSSIAARSPDLLILDLGLPDRDGVEVIAHLREWSSLPVIVLSARTAEPEKVRALDAGADDFLTKPFGIAELIARVRAQLRRERRGGPEPMAEVRFGDIEVDFLSRTVKRDGEKIHLTPIEYRLLTVMINNAGKVLTHRTLLKAVWGAGAGNANHYLRVYVGHLRRKLERDAARPEHLITETGVGYRFLR